MSFRSARLNLFLFLLVLSVYSNSVFSKVGKSSDPHANNPPQQSAAANATVDIRDEYIVKRVGVSVFTNHPSTGKIIMLISSASNPHAAPDGYRCCFPGTVRYEGDTWEHNAAKGLNEKTCYFFARMLDEKKELFFRSLYNDNENIRTETQERAHQIICTKLKNARFMQINEHSRLYFLYIPYKNFGKELSAKLIFNQREQNFDRFGWKITSSDNALRPGRYFHWIKPPRNTDNLELAFENDGIERDLGFKMSPYAILRWNDLNDIEESFLEIPLV